MLIERIKEIQKTQPIKEITPEEEAFTEASVENYYNENYYRNRKWRNHR